MTMDNQDTLQILSFNVRGLRDSKKRREIFRWLKRYHEGAKSICLLQETHSSVSCEHTWQHEWGSKIYFCHGSHNSKGVAILMPLKYNFDITELFKDIEGRILALTITQDDTTFNIVNIYAPTKDKSDQQLDFLKILDSNIELAESQFLIGGDFNTYFDPVLDKDGGKMDEVSKYAQSLNMLMNEYNITDVWRVLNPHRKLFTWRQSKPLIQSRLDYFLLSGELFYNVHSSFIKPSIKSDHSILILKINIFKEQKRGPGFWKFNTALLQDDVYIDVIRELIESLKITYAYILNHGLKWDLIKSEIHQFTIDYCKTQAKIRRQVENELREQYNDAALKFEMDNTSENLEAIENIKSQIEEINKFKSTGAHLRSKAEYIEENERSTAYFLNLEKRNYKMKHIKKLNISDTETILNPKDILNEEMLFYKKLYTKNNNVNKMNYSIFFNQHVPRLSEEDKNFCDQHLALEEISKALLTLKNGKSPGSDGFPPEFYKMFWKNIQSLVTDSLLYAIQNKELSIDQRRGILKLIVKKDKNPCFLKNWRPISLLNTDYKILAQIFSLRLQKILPNIISECQNGYIKGRFIGYNIRTIVDIILLLS